MKARAILFGLVAVVLAGVAAAGNYFTSVASHSTPEMVVEINAALNAIEDRTDGTTTSDLVAKSLLVTNSAAASATVSVVGANNQDATLVLDADKGDDNADTWTIESEQADNDLSFVNHTSEVMKLTSGGALTVSDDLTCDKIIFTDAALAVPTNALSGGFLVTVNGTNYWLGLYPVND